MSPIYILQMVHLAKQVMEEKWLHLIKTTIDVTGTFVFCVCVHVHQSFGDRERPASVTDVVPRLISPGIPTQFVVAFLWFC